MVPIKWKLYLPVLLLLRLGLLPRICLSTYKSRKRKAKEKPFNFLLHRFEIEINQ